MPLILLLIVGIFCLVLSGMWIGTIIDGIYNDENLQFSQFAWAIGGFLYGIFCIIACVGHVAAV